MWELQRHICQYCEDHFATAGATGSNRTPFVVLFLCARINFRWHQYKRRKESGSQNPPAWVEFKAFLRKNLGDSRAFVNTIWDRIKRDSQYLLQPQPHAANAGIWALGGCSPERIPELK